MAEKSPFARSLFVGAVLGLVVVAATAAFLLLGDPSSLSWNSKPPSSLLVIAVSPDAEGAQVAGSVFVLGDTCDVEVVDTFAEVDIPGTSYSLLRDAYTFGGGEALASAYADTADLAEEPEWLVLDQETWEAAVNAHGGASVEVPSAINVYLNDEFFSIEQGAQTLEGRELSALIASESNRLSSETSEIQLQIAAALGTAVCSSGADIVSAVEVGTARSSVNATRLEAFISEVGTN